MVYCVYTLLWLINCIRPASKSFIEIFSQLLPKPINDASLLNQFKFKIGLLKSFMNKSKPSKIKVIIRKRPLSKKEKAYVDRKSTKKGQYDHHSTKTSKQSLVSKHKKKIRVHLDHV